jgi:hypothetical protein
MSRTKTLKIGIDVDVSEVKGDIESLKKILKAQLDIIGDITARNMEVYAKSNKPWKNRTGDAQSLLNGKSSWESDDILDMAIAHGVYYGVYLETRRDFQGKYKILEEARDSQIANFKSMLMRLKLGG